MSEIGGKVIQQAPSAATADAQIEFINNLVSQGVNVIAIAGNDANAVAPALKRAAAQGVGVVAYDSDVRQAGPGGVHEPGQVRQPGRADAGEHGQADRLRGRVRDPVLDADGHQPERLDRLHEGEARGRAQVRQDEAGPGRLWRGERAGQPAAGAGAGPGLSRPQGHHHPGRHRPAGRRARARAGRADRQDQADRPRPRHLHDQVHQGRPGRRTSGGTSRTSAT